MQKFLRPGFGCVLFLAGCSPLNFRGADAVIPEFVVTQPMRPDQTFLASVDITAHYRRCTERYCYISGSSVASGRGGVSEPASPQVVAVLPFTDGDWTWRLEQTDDPYVLGLGRLSTPAPGAPCPSLPANALEPNIAPALPPRPQNLACAMARVHQLMSQLYPRQALPPVDITLTTVPFGRRSRQLWPGVSNDKITLHYLLLLKADGTPSLGDLAMQMGVELTQAYAITGQMPWGPLGADDAASRVRQETRAVAVGACAVAAVTGRNLRRAWSWPPLTAGQSVGLPADDADGKLKSVYVPAFEQAQQNVSAAYARRNGGSTAYDGANPHHVRALFDLCRDTVGSLDPAPEPAPIVPAT